MWMLEKPEEHLKIFLTMRVRGGQCVTVGEVARELSAICSTRLVPAREGRNVLNSDYSTVLFTEDTNYRVLYSAAKVTKEKETVSGDSYACRDEEGQLVMCLSDGMAPAWPPAGRARRWWSFWKNLSLRASPGRRRQR